MPKDKPTKTDSPELAPLHARLAKLEAEQASVRQDLDRALDRLADDPTADPAELDALESKLRSVDQQIRRLEEAKERHAEKERERFIAAAVAKARSSIGRATNLADSRAAPGGPAEAVDIAFQHLHQALADYVALGDEITRAASIALRAVHPESQVGALDASVIVGPLAQGNDSRASCYFLEQIRRIVDAIGGTHLPAYVSLDPYGGDRKFRESLAEVAATAAHQLHERLGSRPQPTEIAA